MDVLPIMMRVEGRACAVVGGGTVAARKAALMRRTGARVTVFAAAEARNVPVNVVDKPALCRFLMPALLERPPFVIAISSGGASPVLARRLRARLEALTPAKYGPPAPLAERLRRLAAAKPPNIGARRRFWDRLFDGPC